MGDSDGVDRLPPPPPSSSDELSSFLQQILSPTPTTQPTSPPKRTVSSAETFRSVNGGAVSSAGYGVADIGHDKCVFENKRNGARQRNLLKRNIDAQFHNLSEKRRRSKINEKMKALQKLIPNSNKTDKASMLDEAIEYLKQLQLQVQSLAFMNSLGLNPMRLPPVLPPTQTRINETFEPQLNLETLLNRWNHLKSVKKCAFPHPPCFEDK